MGGFGAVGTENCGSGETGDRRVLFIDEAYALVGDEYGDTAIDILVKAAEDYRDDLVIVLAGYTDPMGELLNTNPVYVPVSAQSCSSPTTLPTKW